MTEDDEKLIDGLVDEYKILQDKIDKIGAFRFTIKGWSITLLLGSLFARSATNALPGWVWIGCFALILSGFFWLELEQSQLSHEFGQRVLRIERVASRVLRRHLTGESKMDFISMRFVPGLGHHIKPASNRKVAPRTRWRRAREAHVWFYTFQAGLVIAVIFFNGQNKPQPPPMTIMNWNAGAEPARLAPSVSSAVTPQAEQPNSSRTNKEPDERANANSKEKDK